MVASFLSRIDIKVKQSGYFRLNAQSTNCFTFFFFGISKSREMDIFKVSRRLARFELPFFHVQADFGSPAPNFRDPIPGVLLQNNIRNFGAGFVGYARQWTRRPFYAQIGRQNIFAENTVQNWLKIVNSCTNRSVILLLVHPSETTKGVDFMPAYHPFSENAVRRINCISVKRGAV